VLVASFGVSSCACRARLRKFSRGQRKQTLATPVGSTTKRTHVYRVQHGKWNRHVRKKSAGRRGVSYVSCHSTEITPRYACGGVYFQMTATSNSGMCTVVSFKMLASSVLLQLAGLHVSALGRTTSHELEAHIVTWHASTLGEIRFWRIMEFSSSQEENTPS
jgi:hypothetical protein